MKDYRTALEKDEDLQRAKEGLAKAQKLEKQASKRDYYKILGVKRTATKKDINKVGTSKKKKYNSSSPHIQLFLLNKTVTVC